MIRILLGLALALMTTAASASTLVFNVQGYTMDDGQRLQFIALEYDQGKVTHLYTDANSVASSHAEKRIDGKGATLLGRIGYRPPFSLFKHNGLNTRLSKA